MFASIRISDAMHDPSGALELLTTSSSITLSSLPSCHGIYVLESHDSKLSYIGETGGSGFRGRIWGYHTTGSEERSHKFSQAYNTGRLWRCRKRHPLYALQKPSDAKVTKDLRALFVRRNCRAKICVINNPGLPKSEFLAQLKALESSVKSIALPAMLVWDGKYFPAEAEPTDLVDALIDELALPLEKRHALQRQAYLFTAHRK